MKLSVSILLFMLVTLSCGQQPTTKERKEILSTSDPNNFNLAFVASTDIHGMIFPYDFLTGEETDHSMAQIATILKDLRKNQDNAVFYVDTGDYYQGQPIIYYYNFLYEGITNLGASALNYLNAYTTSVGNHDIEVGQQVYDDLVNQMDFPYLAANALHKDTDEPYFEAYTISEVNGLKVAFLGMVTPSIPQWLPEVLWKDMYFEDIAESSKKWISLIEEKENPDFIVGLFHSGLGEANAPYMAENAALYTALNVEGYDIIFEGHDHQAQLTNVSSPSGKNVLIIGANDAIRTLSQVIVPVTKKEGQWEFGTFQAEIINVKGQGISADPEFMAEFKKEFEESKEFLTRSVGKISEQISSQDSIFGPSKFVDLIHQLQIQVSEEELKMKVDISFSAPLSVDAVLNKGNIYFSDLFSLYRYENWLYIMELTGQEIKDALEYNYGNWVDTMKSPEDYMILYKRDANNNLIINDRYNTYDTVERFYNYDTAVGIDYTVDLTKDKNSKINILKMSTGEDFDLNKKYKVAINSYRGNGGGGHLTIGAGIPKDQLTSRILAATDKDLRFYLGNAITKAKSINPPLFNNWKFIPEDWAAQAKKREHSMWFPKN